MVRMMTVAMMTPVPEVRSIKTSRQCRPHHFSSVFPFNFHLALSLFFLTVSGFACSLSPFFIFFDTHKKKFSPCWQ